MRTRGARAWLLSSALAVVTTVAGCAAATPSESTSTTNVDTVEVVRRDLAPVLSLNGTILANAAFWAQSSAAGVVRITPGIRPGTKVDAGQALATVGDTTVASPVPATVSSITVPSDVDVPKRFPLVALTYTGFAVSGSVDPSLSWMTLSNPATGRGQITNGPAPFDCAAVVIGAAPDAASADVSASTGSEEDAAGTPPGSTTSIATNPSELLCLLPKDTEGAAGAQAITVITAPVVENAAVLPLSAVAGRSVMGEVTVVSDGQRRRTGVELGQSDGQYIEILSGVEPGDHVAAVAPNLDEKFLQ